MRYPRSQLVSGKVTFSGILTNAGSGYNKQTGEFVCPVAGLYHFYFSFMQMSTTYVYCYIKHNRDLLTQARTYSANTWSVAATSAFVQLAVGDIVNIGPCLN